MRNEKTVNELNDKFFEIEKKFNLFEVEIDGIYFWKLIRINLFNEILAAYGHYNRRDRKRQGFFNSYYRLILNAWKFSVFNSKNKVDIVFFENPRKVQITQNDYIDPYTHFYIKKLLFSKKIEILDEGFNGLHYEPTTKFRKFTESIWFDLIYKNYIKFFNVKFTDSENKLIEHLSEIVNLNFQLTISLKKITSLELQKFRLQFVKYSTYFKQRCPSQIYLVCSYGKEGLIHAAKSLGIEVIELQHGLISEYHKGYSYQGKSEIKYFPDKILLFGDYWNDSSSLPLKTNSISVVGYEYFNKMASKYFQKEKRLKTVLVISQPSLGNSLLVKTIELANENKNYHFIFRLHPKERTTFLKYQYTLSEEIRRLKNFEFDFCEKIIYESLASVEYLIGVSSTSVFEALAFDIKIILINIAASNSMSFLIDNEYVHLFDLNDKIDFSELRDLKKIDLSYLFKDLKHAND